MSLQYKKDKTRLYNLLVKYRNDIITFTTKRAGEKYLKQVINDVDDTISNIERWTE
jgi:hypothetical protein